MIVGIRDAQNNPCNILREVEKGEDVEVSEVRVICPGRLAQKLVFVLAW
jgi:hypothetical protein